MLFNSYIFVLLFMPLSIGGYFILNSLKKYRLASAFLLLMSLWFYAYFNIKYLPIIVSSILLNYLFYRLFKTEKLVENHVLRKMIFVIAMVFNIGVLFYYKYFSFFIDNINAVFGTDYIFEKLILPLGISFFTFQQMSFIIDSYDVSNMPNYDFLNYALFVSYYPQLIAGPIVTHDSLVPQFNDLSKRIINYDNLSKGLFHFTLGLSKKVLIADVVGSVVDTSYASINSLDSLAAIVVMFAYMVQLYFDFSGYSDMALGLAKMINIDLPVNFNSPHCFKSNTIETYWSRHHITLTSFFTKYLYIPLGGNRKGVFRTYVNVMIVFLVSGLWHGADWSFVLWGALHGIGMCLTKIFKKEIEKLPRIISWSGTCVFHLFSLVLFRADSIADFRLFIAQLFSGIRSFNLLNTGNVIFYITLFIALALMIIGYNAKDIADHFKPNWCYLAVTNVLLLACILSFQEVSTFLYFNF